MSCNLILDKIMIQSFYKSILLHILLYSEPKNSFIKEMNSAIIKMFSQSSIILSNPSANYEKSGQILKNASNLSKFIIILNVSMNNSILF